MFKDTDSYFIDSPNEPIKCKTRLPLYYINEARFLQSNFNMFSPKRTGCNHMFNRTAILYFLYQNQCHILPTYKHMMKRDGFHKPTHIRSFYLSPRYHKLFLIAVNDIDPNEVDIEVWFRIAIKQMIQAMWKKYNKGERKKSDRKIKSRIISKYN